MTVLAVDDLYSSARISILHGATRTVILVGALAFKLPNLRYGWRPFLRGLIANAIEREWWNATHDENLCPILFSIPGGWLVVMPRCEPVVHFTDEVFERTVRRDCCDHTDDIHAPGGGCALCPIETYEHDYESYVLPVENKDDSFGWFDPTHTAGNGRLVAVDYGN